MFIVYVVFVTTTIIIIHSFVYLLQAFFCERSDYFKALVEDHFGEASGGISSDVDPSLDNIQSITLRDISASVFYRVLSYIYCDSAEVG
jgi:ankyrin repeat/BTB/POZ domain-containing protein 1